MADQVPARLKSLQLASFAKRAAQLARFKPIITYWLRFYMVQKIIAGGLHSADHECTAYTTDLMEKLEQAKAESPSEDALLDDVAASAYCEQFALQTLAKGEKEMAENRANGATADTLLAASTFLEILSIWNKDSSDIASKTKFAKYHALRIVKAIKAGEDPNLTNPVQETQPDIPSPPVLDPNDPEVQRIDQAASLQPLPNPYQPYAESAPDTSVQPSPAVSPLPPTLPIAPSGYAQAPHNDVSPISQPTSSRQGSIVSAGGGYFPRTDPALPTFTAETIAPGLAIAPSTEEDPFISGLPASPQVPPEVPVADPASFGQEIASPQPPPTAQNPYQSPPQSSYSIATPSGFQAPRPPMVQPAQPSQSNPFALPSTPPPQPPQRGVTNTLSPSRQYSPVLQQNTYAQNTAPHPQQLSQGPFRNDEDSIMQAQKHAKWAISALNFEDADTAVKELRIALRALGAN
ncbi:hypothetical protein ACN47E_002928 [Coniothyrium glycines]